MGTRKLLEFIVVSFKSFRTYSLRFLKCMQVRLLVGVLKSVGTGDLNIPDGGALCICFVLFYLFNFF